MSLDIKMDFNEAQIAKLVKLPLLVRHAVGDKCLKAMTKPVVAKAKLIAPSSITASTKSPQGSRAKWSQKYKSDSGYQNDSGKSVGSRVIKTAFGAIVFVGFTHPKGNKQQFNQSEKGRRVVLWGKMSLIARAKPTERVMQRAYDETKPEQLSAFNAQLEIEIKEINFG